MKPWFTSNDIIEAVQRKISFPLSQVTFNEDDILAFANEEMSVSQVPSILQFHQEYFVAVAELPLVPNQSHYQIPERAIGMRLRDVFYKDTGGNLTEMIRTNPDDKAFFSYNDATNSNTTKFYLEGNDIVLIPFIGGGAVGSLLVSYFLRPNQLVTNDQAAIITSFVTTITVDNASLVAGDTLTINSEVFTAVNGSPSTDEFQIGATSAATAVNLFTAINMNGVASATGTNTSNIVTVLFSSQSTTFISSNTTALALPSTLFGVRCDQIPSDFSSTSIIDFLQTRPGHKTLALSKQIQILSGTDLYFNVVDVPSNLILNDYICIESQCIIPQIPSDLHIGLVERTCARVLSAIGDAAGLSDVNAKIAEIDKNQGMLLDSRVDGAPQKVFNRRSLLRYGKYRNSWWRF